MILESFIYKSAEKGIYTDAERLVVVRKCDYRWKFLKSFAGMNYVREEVRGGGR